MSAHVAGDVVKDPMAMWRKYAHDHGRTVRHYDLAVPGNPGVLTAEEAWKSWTIHSRLTYQERDQIVARAPGSSYSSGASRMRIVGV
jgi:hypothetical protein